MIASRVTHLHPCFNLGTPDCEQFTFCFDPACPILLEEAVLCLPCWMPLLLRQALGRE